VSLSYWCSRQNDEKDAVFLAQGYARSAECKTLTMF
jgi:hypothetical protein